MPSVKKLVADQAAKQQASAAAPPPPSTATAASFEPPARVEAAPSPSAPSSSPAPPRSNGGKVGEGTIDVVARHAIQGLEVKVTLPKRARFKHVKKALAKLLGNDEITTRGQLMKKDAGIYNAFKDAKKIGDVRQVLVVCADFGSLGEGGEALACGLAEDEVSSDDEPAQAAKTAEGASRAGATTTGSAGTGAIGSSIRSGIFTRKQAIALQQELFEGFSADQFQRDLKALAKRKNGGSLTPTEFVQARQDLFLTVQGRVLPRFGFEGSTSGVYKMMGAMGPFIKDPEFVELAKRINELIGVESKPDTWGDLSTSCQKLDAQPQDAGPAAKAKAKAKSRPTQSSRFGMGIGGGFLAGGFGRPSRDGGFEAGLPQALADDEPQGRAGAGGGVQQQAEAAWPAGRPPPFSLHVAGTFNDFSPTEMDWDEEGGLFVCPIQVGQSGRESFQLLVDGSYDRTLYPSRANASNLEEHSVLGPDGRGHGKNWLIGGRREEQARPGQNFAICVALSAGGKVRLVDWQPF